MSVLITSDLHFTDNPRDAYRFGIKKSIGRLLKKYEVETLIIGGDLTEFKDNHSAWLVNQIVEVITYWASISHLKIMLGNHDGYDPSFPFFKFLGKIKNIQWINDVTEQEVTGLGSCCFLPHTRNYERDWKDLDFGSYDWIFAHATFHGAITESGFKLEGGIPVDIFPEDARVISGDIHKPQKLGPVTYVGAPYTVDFGDDYQPRVLLIEDGRLKSVKMSGAQKRLLKVDCVSENGMFIDPGPNVELPNPGDILKVRVQLEKHQYANWSSIQQEVRRWGEDKGFIIHTVQPVLEPKERKDVKKIVKKQHEKVSDKELLKRYSKNMDVDDKTILRGLNIMNKV